MRESPRDLKVAIVHYWFAGYTGGERVVEALAEMFPQADLFALVADPRQLPSRLQGRKLTTSFLQKIPGKMKWYRHLLPLQPLALEQLDVSGYDLILSSESGPAKGVISPASSCHICYCHSPMRYVWDMYHDYRKSMGPVVRPIFSAAAHYIRNWDLASAARVDYFAANSHNVARRIQKHYRRESTVIYPPVNVSVGYIADRVDDYYLVVSRLIDYKRVDLAIQACNRLKRRLRIIGDGDQYKNLRSIAGSTIEFLGRVDDETVRENYAHCRALLFPGDEDFGIVPVEAQSFGRPVIAYAKGGALETVIGDAHDSGSVEQHTGIFFTEPTVDSLAAAIQRFEMLESRFSPEFIRHSVQGFSESQFKACMGTFIDQCLEAHRAATPAPRREQLFESNFAHSS